MIKEIPWLQPSPDAAASAGHPDLETWSRAQIDAHVERLRAFGDEPFSCDARYIKASLEDFLPQMATRDNLLAAAKAGAHAAYDAAPEAHEAMGRSAWDALLAHARESEPFVLWEVALEVARQAAREVAADRVSKEDIETGSSGGDAGGAWMYVGRENGKYAAKAVASRSLHTMPAWAALAKARDKATETTFMSVDPGIIDAAHDASMESSSLVARHIASQTSLEEESKLTASLDLAHEAARHVSWYLTWTPTDDPRNPWAPLFALWQAGLGVFRLLDSRVLILETT